MQQMQQKFPSIAKCSLPLCAVGQGTWTLNEDPKDKDKFKFMPQERWTTLLASTEDMVKYFRQLRCTHDRYGDGGEHKVLSTQVCKMLANSLEKVLAKDADMIYVGKAYKWPPGTLFGCPSCLKQRVSWHPEHTRRSEPPELCRFHDQEVPDTVTCPACLSGLTTDITATRWNLENAWHLMLDDGMDGNDKQDQYEIQAAVEMAMPADVVRSQMMAMGSWKC